VRRVAYSESGAQSEEEPELQQVKANKPQRVACVAVARLSQLPHCQPCVIWRICGSVVQRASQGRPAGHRWRAAHPVSRFVAPTYAGATSASAARSCRRRKELAGSMRKHSLTEAACI
jgi:DNA polymerase III psi subunit